MTRKDLDEIFSKAKKTNVSHTIEKKSSLKSPAKTSLGIQRSSSSKTNRLSNPHMANSSRKSGSSSDPFGLTPLQNNNSLDLTEEGWKVYTPEELNIGLGGDTPECPFDCNCCF